jgi:hypothetical protein
MRIGIFFVLVCASLTALAQDDIEISLPVMKKDSVRDLYIRRFPDHFNVYPVIKQRGLSFELEKRDRSDLLTFKPNNSYSFGVGLYLFELNFELAFAIPLDENSKSIYGSSKARDIQVNVLGRRFGVDAFYQKYSGFYITDKGDEPQSGSPYPQRPDIASRNFGLTGNYVLNHQKFSFRSVYNFAERQLYSKGSVLIFSNIGSFRLTADSSILSNPQQVIFGDKVSFTRLRYTTFSLAPGYTYSLIFKNFFLNGTLSLGPAHHWINYKLEDGTDHDEIAINLFVAARIGIGYNGDRLFGGITFITQGSAVRFEDVRFSANNGAFKILLGYRFREFGFLKKRVWDLIPFKI